MIAGATLLRIGTRGSALALRQAAIVAAALRGARPASAAGPATPGIAVAVEIVTIETPGDGPDAAAGAWRNDRPGLFTRAVTAALAQGDVDVAVHSLKDLPIDPEPGIVRAAVLPREDASDVLVSRSGLPLHALPAGSRVGTSSLRRRAHVVRRRRDVEVVECHGNVPTRIRAVRDGALDAVVLARAGLVRLGLEQEIAEVFPIAAWLPAPGQGAIVIEARAGDRALLGRLRRLDDVTARLSTTAERGFMAALGAGCRMPVAAAAAPAGDAWSLIGQVASVADGRIIRASARRPLADEAQAWRLGQDVAGAVLDLGGAALDAGIRTEATRGR